MRCPALQMLAGPARGVIWLAVVMQLVWVLWQVAPGAGRLAPAVDVCVAPRSRSASLTMAFSGVAAARLTGTVLFPAGDEPHYLIIAQSLWRDGDLKIENNHARRDYNEYFAPRPRAPLS